MGPEIIIPFTFFFFLGAVILVPIWLKERTRQATLKIVQDSLEKGQPVDPALLQQITGAVKAPPPADRARRTLGSGVVLVALAGGFTAAAFLADGGADSGFIVPAVILGALGAAFLMLAIVDYSTTKKDE
ncbi:MAG: hypothetical protein K2P58_03860 [Hyphomonadaceae bacterium]|nr:hypothetical protein [Hyphomonadaceae bacterium]